MSTFTHLIYEIIKYFQESSDHVVKVSDYTPMYHEHKPYRAHKHISLISPRTCQTCSKINQKQN